MMVHLHHHDDSENLMKYRARIYPQRRIRINFGNSEVG